MNSYDDLEGIITDQLLTIDEKVAKLEELYAITMDRITNTMDAVQVEKTFNKMFTELHKLRQKSSDQLIAVVEKRQKAIDGGSNAYTASDSEMSLIYAQFESDDEEEREEEREEEKVSV